MVRHLVAALIRRDLRRGFRRIVWLGSPPALPHGHPAVLVANHQSFYDGHLLWLLVTQALGRPFVVWMEELERFPFFATQGALPFPRDDSARRAATIRRTRRSLQRRPASVLCYFPEGTLHSPDEPLRPFTPERLDRLHRVLGAPHWWPVAIHVTWWRDSRPTAFLAAGPPRRSPRGSERAELEELRQRLRRVEGERHVLYEGRPGPEERWNLRWMRRLLRGST